jgi:hypothetical protein
MSTRLEEHGQERCIGSVNNKGFIRCFTWHVLAFTMARFRQWMAAASHSAVAGQTVTQ